MAARDPYFDDLMSERQALVWAAAARRQLARWEPLVAKHCLVLLEPQLDPPPAHPTAMTTTEYWQGETERHLLLVALRHLVVAAGLMDQPPSMDADVVAELREVRDLNEHWDESMPVFQAEPRAGEPQFRSGKRFAARHPRHGPYCWWAWDGALGPLVAPTVSGTQVYELVDAVVEAAEAARPDLAGTVPPAAPRPWRIPVAAGEMWWPDLDATTVSELG